MIRILVTMVRRRRRGPPQIECPMSDRRSWRRGLLNLGLLLASIRYMLGRTLVPAAIVAMVVIVAIEGGPPARLLLIPAVLAYLAWAVITAARERHAVAVLGHRPIDDPHARDAAAPMLTRLCTRAKEPATWREVAHAVVATIAAPVECLFVLAWLTAPLWLATPLLVRDGPGALGPFRITAGASAWTVVAVAVLLILFGALAVIALARAHASITTALLRPRGDELRDRVTALARSRSRLIDAFDVERRRIERDLHDGAQQQLVALAMTLDLARIELEDAPHPGVTPLVERAHTQATTTLRELRELIDGIHPTVLTERGLSAAAQALADRSSLPVHVHDAIAGALPPAVATTAYFVIAEALTNAAKHSGATEVHIRLRTHDGHLIGEVTDNGRGGADPNAGTGLSGLADRVSAVDGELTLISPPGGPTTLRVTIPLHDPHGDA
jgi:signal transduction histidine kinase